jgi:hypothetical protein
MLAVLGVCLKEIKGDKQMDAGDRDKLYIGFDQFQGEDGELTLRSVKLVTTRKEHACMAPDGETHTIPAGSRARFEKALVDGDYFGHYYTCIECIERELQAHYDCR